MTLLAVAEAQARLCALRPPLPREDVAPAAAGGRWAAAPLHALRTQPAAPLSAMDGYAIRFAERPGPWRLVGESAAGGVAPALAPGETARIFTGAPLPAGADSILVQEDTTRTGDVVTMTGSGPAGLGAHVRPRGQDFGEGERLVPAGARFTPARIALAVAGGHGRLPVHRPVRITILSTGDELVAPGVATLGTLLPASNAPMLAGLLARPGVAVTDAGIVRDDTAALRAAFLAAAAGADIILTSGGASVGDRDLVAPALRAAGGTIDFWRVAVKPGKPLLAGTIGDAVVLGLPGNPVSALVTAHLFLLPLVAAMGGAADPLPSPFRRRLVDALPPTGARAEYLRGAQADGGVRALGRQDSAGLATLADATLLIVRPPHAAEARSGDEVEVIDLG